jgi:hypothetical protein
MKSIVKWLSTPYYFNHSGWFRIKTSLIISVLIFLFLFLFKPFSISFFPEKVILEYTLLIGIISFFGALYNLFIPPYIFKNFFNEDEWTIGKNFALIFFGILFTGTILWFFSDYYKVNNGIERLSYPIFLVNSYLVGLLPISFIIVLNEKKVRLKREKLAEKINNLKKEIVVDNTEIILFSDNNKESISFKIDALVYITSQGNYASFFLLENGKLKEKILRVTLTKVSKELEKFTNIIRCHKSYFINNNYIQKISGNARGYLIDEDFIEFQIPVSRNFSKESLEEYINKPSHSSQKA